MSVPFWREGMIAVGSVGGVERFRGTVSAAWAEDMEDGENPWYPCRVDRVEPADESGTRGHLLQVVRERYNAPEAVCARTEGHGVEWRVYDRNPGWATSRVLGSGPTEHRALLNAVYAHEEDDDD